MKFLKELLQNMLPITESEWDIIRNVIIEKRINPKEQLINDGQIAKAIYFVKDGLLRVYHLKDGKEITTYFSSDGLFISTYSSFITQKPTFEILEAIEESIVYEFSYQALNNLYQLDPKFEKIGRYLAEQNYLCIFERTLSMQTKTAKEKYLDFITTNHPKIVQRAPQHQIASFLGIAPESLSRIRREIVIS
ncbi:MAG: cyclic nucleotide-binding domain-containing protein [Crocinitomix sp.]|nr:cyclic nucleotide-binding domain-containing protein [Crocinitomix sp.]